MPTENGYSNQKAFGRPQFKTIHNVGADKYATNVITKGLIERSMDNLVITAVARVTVKEGTKEQPGFLITIPTHGAKRPGEVVRFYTGALSDLELDILQVVSPNQILVYDVVDNSIPVINDEVKIAYYRTPQFDISGNIITSSGPVQYVLDDVTVEAEEDTTFPVNNKALPVGLFIKKEGVTYPVNDSVTPSEVVAVPVKIMSAGGTNINITAGDIDVSLTDIGPNFDSVRVGDGSGNYIGVNADKEALVLDTKALAALADLLTELKLKADLLETQPVSVAALPLPSGGATSANQNTGNTTLANLFTELQLKADLTETQPVSVAALPLPTGAATEATLAAQSAKLPATLGQKTTALSLAVALSAAQEAILASLDTKLSNLISSNAVRSFDSIGQLLTTGTLAAPAGAKGFTIQNSSRSNGALRFTKTAGASASVGYLLEPGQSTSYQDGAGSLSVFDVDGTGIDCTVLWYV